MGKSEFQWLSWSRKLYAIAQNGLVFAEDPYDADRYEQIRSIAADIVSVHSNMELDYIRAIFSEESGYATPKVDVRAVVIKQGTILLVKEKSDGLWSLPGGWADVNDAPSEAITREILEESGYRTKAVRLLALYDRDKHGHPPFPFHVYKLFFECEILSGKPQTSIETDAVDFFDPLELPPLSTTRVTAGQILRLFELCGDQASPTDFD